MINTILIVTFVALIAFTVLAFIAGLIKGMYKTIVKTVLEVVLILIFVFLTPTIANAVGNIDLSNFNVYFDITVNGVVHNLHLTTIQQTLADIISSTGLISPINGISIYQTAIALSTSILSYVLFFVEVLIVQLFIWLFNAIIYNGIFRWFLPVETRKEAKNRKKNKTSSELVSGLVDETGHINNENKNYHRLKRHPLIGGLIGACGEFVLVVVLLSPVTSFAKIIIKNKETLRPFVDLLPDDVNKYYDEFIDAYDGSIIKSINGLGGIDDLIMNSASQVEISGEKVSLNNLINATLDIASPLINNGSIKDISFEDSTLNITINYSILLSDYTINEIITSLVANNVVLALIPPFIDLAVNNLSSGTPVLSELDLSNIDWKSELSIINNFYQEIYKTGIVSSFIKDDGNRFDYSDFVIPTGSMSDETISYYGNAVEELGKLEIIKKNMPTLLAGIGTYLTSIGTDIIPTDESVYQNIDWSHDLRIIVENALKMFRLFNIDVTPEIVDLNFQDIILESLKEENKRDRLETYVLGDAANNSKGLLDLEILNIEQFNLSSVFTTILDSITPLQPYLEGIDLSTVLAGFDIRDLKSEVQVYFDACDNIFGPGSFFMDENFSFETLDWGNEEVATQFVEILNILEESSIFQKLYAPTLKTFLHNTNIDLDTYLFGLTPYDFNYDSEDFLNNFESLLTLLPNIKKMTDALSNDSLSNAEKINAIDTNTLRQLLNIVANSDFFNAPKKTGATQNEITNANIYTLLNNLFNDEAIKNLGFFTPDKNVIANIDWGNGYDGKEIDKICDALDYVKVNTDFFLDPNFDLDKLSDSSAISGLINSGLDSEILRPSILQIIDTSLNRYLNDLGIPLSLQDMRVSMWKEDADDIAKLLDLLKGLDLLHLDIEQLDGNRLNAILTILKNTNIVNSSGNNFGNIVYSLLKKLNFFSKLNLNSISLMQYFVNADWSSTTSSIELEINSQKITALVTTNGEIRTLCEFIDIINQHGWIDSISQGKLPSDLIDTVINDDIFLNSYLLRGLFTDILAKSTSQINFGSEYNNLFSVIDFSCLIGMSEEEFEFELTLFSKLYELSVDGGLSNIMANILSLSDEQLVEITSLIQDLGSSKLFTTLKEDSILTPLGELFKVFLEQHDLIELVTFNNDSTQQTNILYGILASVSDWKNEMSIFAEIIINMQGFDVSDLNIVTLNDYKLNSLETLCNLMNQSQVFHRLPISLLANGFEDYDIESLLIDTSGNIKHHIDFDVHLSVHEDDISYWANDIHFSFRLFSSIRGVLQSTKSFSNIVFGDTNMVSTSILAYIGKMNIFMNSRSYVAYNLINNTLTSALSSAYTLSDFLMPDALRPIAPYGEDSDSYRFEQLEYSNSDLLTDEGIYDLEKGLLDLELFDELLSDLINILPDISDINSYDNVYFYQMTSKVFELDNSFKRSTLSSELMASLMRKQLELINQFLTNSYEVDFYSNSYFLTNPIEGKAVDALLNTISKILQGDSLFTKDEVSHLFNELSIKESSDPLITHFIETDFYVNTHNSLVGISYLKSLSEMIFVETSTGQVSLSTFLADYLDELINNSISISSIPLDGILN